MFKLAVLPVVFIAIGVVAVSSYSTLAGPGPIALVPPTSQSSQAGENSGPSQSPLVQEQEAAEQGQGADRKAQAIADEFGVTKDEVLARRDEGIGWGALFKLYKLASAQGISTDDLLSTIPVNENGEREFRFGELRKALTDEQRALYESGPKNLGQLVSVGSTKAHKLGDEGQGRGPSEDGSQGSGKIPPGQAKKRR
jgi:hypothetical protein